MLVREHGDDLTTDELIGIAGLLLHRRARDHLEHARARAPWPCCGTPSSSRWCATTRARSTPAVEELLRWLAIVHSGIPRITTADVEVAGVADPGRASW